MSERSLQAGPAQRRTVSRLPVYTAKNIFAFIGLPFLAWCLYLVIGNVVMLSMASRATGRVTTILGSGGKNPSPYPLVSFKTATGKEFDIIGNGLSSYEVGDQVEVLYYPGSPKGAKINSLKQLWFFPSIAFLFGALFTYAAFGPTEKILKVIARSYGVKVT